MSNEEDSHLPKHHNPLMKKTILWLAAIVLCFAVAISGYAVIRGALNSADGGEPSAVSDAEKEEESTRGIASFYGVDTNGTQTASGVGLNDSLSTAAHRTLPFGTMVRVTNLDNGKSEIVTITDRGPYVEGRIIDLSRNAAGKLDMITDGVASVKIEVLP